jgi:type VI secretion system protein ImpH
MANTDGNTPDPLREQLAKRPYAFDFFRTVRLLECRRPDLPRVGFSLSPAEDPVRFWQNPSLRFAPASLDSVEWTATHAAPRIAVNFFGLFGPNAPLPTHITEYVLERQLHHKDTTITAFFNLFHHRLLSLFYRAWAANQKAVDLDRPREQRYAVYLGALFGVGMEALQNQDAVPDLAKLFFAGRLACQTRNAEGLESILRQYFQIPSEVRPFAGRWLALPADSVWRLGATSDCGSLGLNTIVGERFWDCQLSFGIRFGPMGLADYERMLPNGESFKRLKDWVLNYCGEHFFWDVQLVLRADEVPATQLGRYGGLGWTTWLKTKPFTQDADELVLRPPAG